MSAVGAVGGEDSVGQNSEVAAVALPSWLREPRPEAAISTVRRRPKKLLLHAVHRGVRQHAAYGPTNRSRYAFAEASGSMFSAYSPAAPGTAAGWPDNSTPSTSSEVRSRIGADQRNPFPGLGQGQGRRAGHTSLADAAFAGEERDSRRAVQYSRCKSLYLGHVGQFLASGIASLTDDGAVQKDQGKTAVSVLSQRRLHGWVSGVGLRLLGQIVSLDNQSLPRQPMEIRREADQRGIHARAADSGGTAHRRIEHFQFLHESGLLFALRRTTMSQPINSNDRHQRLQPPQHLVVDAVAHARALFPAADQAGVLQNPKVLGDGRLRQRQLVHNLAANPRFLAGQKAQYAHAGGMGDRLRQHLKKAVMVQSRSSPARIGVTGGSRSRAAWKL